MEPCALDVIATRDLITALQLHSFRTSGGLMIYFFLPCLWQMQLLLWLQRRQFLLQMLDFGTQTDGRSHRTNGGDLNLFDLLKPTRHQRNHLFNLEPFSLPLLNATLFHVAHRSQTHFNNSVK